MRIDRFSINPKTWLVLGLSAVPLALISLDIGARAVLLLLLICVVARSGKLHAYGRYVLLGVGPVAVTAFCIQAVSFVGAQTIYAQWTPTSFLNFRLSKEGILYGATLGLQILNFGTACAIAFLPVSAGELRWALTDWKLPSRLIYLLVTSMNAPVLLSRYVGLVRESQVRRGLDDSTVFSRSKLALTSIGTLINLILLEHEDRAQSLEQRGLDRPGERVFLRTYPDTQLQRVLRWIVGACGICTCIWGILA